MLPNEHANSFEFTLQKIALQNETKVLLLILNIHLVSLCLSLFQCKPDLRWALYCLQMSRATDGRDHVVRSRVTQGVRTDGFTVTVINGRQGDGHTVSVVD